MVYEDVEIDGVVLLKGTDIKYNIIGAHYNKS